MPKTKPRRESVKKQNFTKDELKIISDDMNGLLDVGKMQRRITVSVKPNKQMIEFIKENQRQDELRESIVRKIDTKE